eukprot:383770_1
MAKHNKTCLLLTIVTAISCIFYSYYYLLMIDTFGTEKWTPYAVNALRYQFSFYPIDYGTNDSLAGIFIPPFIKYLSDSPIFRWITIHIFINQFTSFGPYISAIAFRTQYFDTIWIEGIEKHNVKQIINIGSGYDDRSIRFQDIITANNVKIFELDLPNLLQKKENIILNHFKWDKLPPYLAFIPCDLDQMLLANCLNNTELFKYDPNVPTIFHMEGIIMYLLSDSVEGIFNFIKQKAYKGSIVATIFSVDLDKMDAKEYNLRNKLTKYGEKYKFTLKTSEIVPFIEKYELKNIEILGARDSVLKYLPKEINDRFDAITQNVYYFVRSEVL